MVEFIDEARGPVETQDSAFTEWSKTEFLARLEMTDEPQPADAAWSLRGDSMNGAFERNRLCQMDVLLGLCYQHGG